MELILMKERNFATPQSGTDITIFGEGEKFRTASNSSSQFEVGRGSSPSHLLRLFLLALHRLGASRCKCLLALPIVRRTPPVLLGKMGLISDRLACLKKHPISKSNEAFQIKRMCGILPIY